MHLSFSKEIMKRKNVNLIQHLTEHGLNSEFSVDLVIKNCKFLYMQPITKLVKLGSDVIYNYVSQLSNSTRTIWRAVTSALELRVISLSRTTQLLDVRRMVLFIIASINVLGKYLSWNKPIWYVSQKLNTFK